MSPRWMLVLIASLLAFASATIAACAGDEPGGGSTDAGDESAADTGDERATDAGDERATDAGTTDAPRDARSRDPNGPGEAGATCSFNFDCLAALRCECDETTGCACNAGPRGTGQNGVDPCDDGNDCESAVCVEGPPDSGFYCSDECQTAADCTGMLPQCTTVAFVGRICIRKP